MKKTLLSLLLIFCGTLAWSQTISSIPGPLLDSINSKIVGEEYKLLLTLPPDYAPETQKYPVLYYTGAWAHSGEINEYLTLGMSEDKIAPLIAIGISYEIDPSDYDDKQQRDLIPPVNESDDKHGGRDFLDFIKTELIPYIEKKYAANPADRGFLGESHGGLFATWTIKEEPNLFHRIGIISPSLRYEDGFLVEDAELLENIIEMAPSRVFLGYGAADNGSFIGLGERLFADLKKNKNIEAEKVLFEGETHETVGPAARARCLKFLYPAAFELSSEIISAIKIGHVVFLETVIKEQDLNKTFQVGEDQLTYLNLSIKAGSVESFNFFLDKGADPNIISNEKTPLMYATKYGQYSMVQRLLNLGVDLNVTIDEKTALDYAIKYEQAKIEELLRQKMKR